jgi:hypothetical protein
MSTHGSSQSFGQNEVFHNHSSNIPHLSTWIDEIIQLTENSLPAKANPTTDELVDAVSRYDACFREMLKQTNVFSPDITRIYSKLWIGVLQLLDQMVKIYHRHVVQTASLQDQARDLIRQRQAQVTATKIKQEEDVLERTGLRATIRNLEGEIIALNCDNRELDRQNRALRALVDTYIDARDFDQSLLTLVHEEKEKTKPNERKRNVIDSQRFHIDELNKLEVEMNEMLSCVQTEEDRQNALFSQLSVLIEKNESLLLHASSGKEMHTAVAPGKRDFSVQVDEKNMFGLVGDVDEVIIEDIPEYPPGELKVSLETEGRSVPYVLRGKMLSFPHVLRIPSLEWIDQTILSIYCSKIRHDMQFSNKFLAVGKLDLAEFVYFHFQNMYGLPALTDMQVMVLLRACQYHASSSKRVFLFAVQLGLFRPDDPPDLDKRDTDLILTVIRSLMDQGELQPQHPHETKQKFIVPPSMAVESLTTSGPPALVRGASSRAMTRENSRVNAEDLMIANKSKEPANQSPFGPTSGTILPYVKRASALFSAQNIFAKWLPDQANEYLMKVRAMPNVKGSFHIDFDDFLEVSMEQWRIVRGIWTDHMHELYNYSSSIFRVVSEVGFATDRGTAEKDIVLVQMIRDPSVQLNPRKLYNFAEASHVAYTAALRNIQVWERNQAEQRQLEDDAFMASLTASERRGFKKRASFAADDVAAVALTAVADAGSSEEKDTGASKKESSVGMDSDQDGPQKDNVVIDLISKKSFMNALKSMMPSLSGDEVRRSNHVFITSHLDYPTVCIR